MSILDSVLFSGFPKRGQHFPLVSDGFRQLVIALVFTTEKLLVSLIHDVNAIVA